MLLNIGVELAFFNKLHGKQLSATPSVVTISDLNEVLRYTKKITLSDCAHQCGVDCHVLQLQSTNPEFIHFR